MIYFIQETGVFRSSIKIGYSNSNIDQRLATFSVGNSAKLRLLLVIPGSKEDESSYHELFSKYRLHGEWFRFGLKLRLFLYAYRNFNSKSPKQLRKKEIDKTLEKANSNRQTKKGIRQNAIIDILKADPDIKPTELTRRLNKLGHEASVSTVKRDLVSLNGKLKGA